MTAPLPTAAERPAFAADLFGHPRGPACVSALAALVIALLVRPLRGMLRE